MMLDSDAVGCWSARAIPVSFLSIAWVCARMPAVKFYAPRRFDFTFLFVWPFSLCPSSVHRSPNDDTFPHA